MLEQGAGEAGGAGEGRLALGLAELGQPRLEQLAHDAERKARLELRPARHEHPEVGPLGETLGGLEQPRLPNPGLAQHHRHRPPAIRRGRDRTPERVQLSMAFEQAVHRRLSKG
jgi:hypothetical protein